MIPLLAMMLAAAATGEALPAFPGAEGGGARARGGRGGRVIEVTTLADSGTGSLRACVEASGPRTCVFRVAGAIVLAPGSGLQVASPYLTIAGQTAPGGGVAVVGKRLGGPARTYGHWLFRITTHDVVIRYLRVWIGSNPSRTLNGHFALFDGARDVILDHVSALWATDKAVSLWSGGTGPAPRDFTLQNSICGEALAEHSTNLIAGGERPSFADAMTDIDFHHNYLPTGGWRNPLFKARSGRFVNNVVYNWNGWAAQVGGGAYVDFIGNVFRRGPIQSESPPEISIFEGNRTTAAGSPSIYLRDNRGAREPDGAHNWERMARLRAGEGFTPELGAVPAARRRTDPLAAATSWRPPEGLIPDGGGVPITARSLQGDGANLWALLRRDVGASMRLDCGGAWVSNRDAADRRAVRYYGRGGPAAQMADERGYGGFPTLAAGTPCPDRDHDGIPDAWEIAHGLDPDDPSDANRSGPDGYTNLERYLNGAPAPPRPAPRHPRTEPRP